MHVSKLAKEALEKSDLSLMTKEKILKILRTDLIPKVSAEQKKNEAKLEHQEAEERGTWLPSEYDEYLGLDTDNLNQREYEKAYHEALSDSLAKAFDAISDEGYGSEE